MQFNAPKNDEDFTLGNKEVLEIKKQLQKLVFIYLLQSGEVS